MFKEITKNTLLPKSLFFHHLLSIKRDSHTCFLLLTVLKTSSKWDKNRNLLKNSLFYHRLWPKIAQNHPKREDFEVSLTQMCALHQCHSQTVPNLVRILTERGAVCRAIHRFHRNFCHMAKAGWRSKKTCRVMTNFFWIFQHNRN